MVTENLLETPIWLFVSSSETEVTKYHNVFRVRVYKKSTWCWSFPMFHLTIFNLHELVLNLWKDTYIAFQFVRSNTNVSFGLLTCTLQLLNSFLALAFQLFHVLGPYPKVYCLQWQRYFCICKYNSASLLSKSRKTFPEVFPWEFFWTETAFSTETLHF